MRPDTVMVFAAGFGTRMGALTATRAKPMVPVAGRPMIDYGLDMIDAAGPMTIIVNTHYRAEGLEAHLASRPNVTTIREEPEILDTGGGLRNARHLLGTGAVFTMNSDVLWRGPNPLDILAEHWDATRMDALMLTVPLDQTVAYTGAGDFFAEPDGRLRRRGVAAAAPLIYSGIQIIKPELTDRITKSVYSVSEIWDVLIAKHRLFGIPFSGQWVDMGHPDGVVAAERVIGQAADV